MGATAFFAMAKAGIAAATTALGPVGAGFVLMYGGSTGCWHVDWHVMGVQRRRAQDDGK